MDVLTASASMLRATLVLALTVFATCMSARSRPWPLVRQILGGAILGGVPAVLMFDSAKRQNPMSGVYVLLAAFVVGTVAGTCGALVGAGRAAGRRRSTTAWAGTALGSFAGTFIAFAVVYSPERDLFTEKSAMIVAAALVGAFATAGYQILGGGSATGQS